MLRRCNRNSVACVRAPESVAVDRRRTTNTFKCWGLTAIFLAATGCTPEIEVNPVEASSPCKIAFAATGQSNMLGSNDDQSGTNQTNDQVQMWDWRDRVWLTSQTDTYSLMATLIQQPTTWRIILDYESTPKQAAKFSLSSVHADGC